MREEGTRERKVGIRGLCERIGEGLVLLLLIICGVQAQGIIEVVHAAGVSPTANAVYGQGGNYTTAIANAPLGIPSATSLNSPKRMAYDSNSNLYIADTNNNRVLYYASGSTTATRVYGQGGSFSTVTANKSGISATSLSGPTAVALDSSNNLYIADSGNNRVLYYASGSTTATRVYGQGGSFTTNTANNGGISATSLSGSTAVALDSSGNLYIADYANNRVLYYASGSTTATQVYGQGGSFTTSTANKGGISATSLSGPFGLVLDSSSNLYIADSGNSRVLYYASGSTTATRVYGQGGSFTASTVNNGGISANSLNGPRAVAVDAISDIYVADYSNNRVLYYPSGSTTATRVYGQSGNFNTNVANYPLGLLVNATTLFQPIGLVFDSKGNLCVADNGNNRVLRFQVRLSVTTQPPTSTTIGAPFTVATSLIDVGSGSVFTDFTGTVSLTIKPGTGAVGAVLNGTTSLAAISGIATFSNISIGSYNTYSSGYILTASSPGVGSVNTNTFSVLGMLTLAGDSDVTIVSSTPATQGVPYTIPFTFTSVITDHRMSTNGWTLYVASAGIKNGAITFPLSLTELDVNSFCSDGTCTPTTFIPVTTLTTTPAPILHAGNAAHTILVDGSYTNQFNGLISVPATAPAGLYTGTITLSLTNNF